jgi:hypothetical protein
MLAKNEPQPPATSGPKPVNGSPLWWLTGISNRITSAC